MTTVLPLLAFRITRSLRCNSPFKDSPFKDSSFQYSERSYSISPIRFQQLALCSPTKLLSGLLSK